MARMGRAALPREVRVAFWDGVRAGLSPEEAAAVAAGAGHAGRRWMAAAGGVKGNGLERRCRGGSWRGGSGRRSRSGWRGAVVPGDRGAAGTGRGAVDGQPGGAQEQPGRDLPGAPGRAGGAGAGPAPEAYAKLAVNGELRAWGRGEAGAELVAGADQPPGRSDEFPGRAGDACVGGERFYQSLYVQGRGRRGASWRACGDRAGRCRRPWKAGEERRAGSRHGEHQRAAAWRRRDWRCPGTGKATLIEGRGQKTPHRHPGRALHPVRHAGPAAGRKSPAASATRSPRRSPGCRTHRRSLTWDRGSEMWQHRQISVAAGVDIYFADPHSPWQRGSNENTNGLLRQYFPRTEPPSGQAARLQTAADELNGHFARPAAGRPRRGHGRPWDSQAA